MELGPYNDQSNWFSIIKYNSDFELFLIEVFGVPREAARKLSPSKGLTQAIGQGRMTEYITEEQFAHLLGFVEAAQYNMGQYDRLLEELEKIYSQYANERQRLINQRRREKYANDPEYRAKLKEEVKQRKSTPKYKEKRNQKQRERYANDPEYRKRVNERQNKYVRERYARDPEYRRRKLDKKNKRERERYARDPEFRRRKNEERNARRRKNREES